MVCEQVVGQSKQWEEENKTNHHFICHFVLLAEKG